MDRCRRGRAGDGGVLRHPQLRPLRGVQDAAHQLLPAAGPDPRRAGFDRVRPGHAHRGCGGGCVRRLRARVCLPATDVQRGQGIGVPHGQDECDGVLALRGFGHLLGGVCTAGWPGTRGALGAGHEPQQDRVPDPQPGDHLHPRLAAGVDRDHRDLHADLHSAARQLRRRSLVLRPAGGAEPADCLPEPTGGHECVLSQGRGATPCDAEPDLRGHAAVHGHPGAGHRAALHVPGHRHVAATGAVPLRARQPHWRSGPVREADRAGVSLQVASRSRQSVTT